MSLLNLAAMLYQSHLLLAAQLPSSHMLFSYILLPNS